MSTFSEWHIFLFRPKPETDLDGSDMDDDHEEEFYYTEVEVTHITHTSSPPTLSHRDMARPPHEGTVLNYLTDLY